MNEQKLEEKLTLLDQLQSACTHCGLCSEACATFQATGWEHESPRGRLQLAARFLHGNIQLKSEALSTFDRCLGCQACESVCPQQVSYREVREIVQEIRRDLQLLPSVVMDSSSYGNWITFAYRVSSLRWRHYGAKWLKIPSLDLLQNSGSYSKQSKRLQVGQPVLAICCMQDLFQHDAIKQAIAFAHRLGVDLQVDRKQPCCGAIFERLVHGGGETICYPKQQAKAVLLQSKARKNFLKWMPQRMYFLSRGCQSFISSAKQLTVDFYAWIENLLIQKNIALYLPQPLTVYYQPYCKSEKGEKDSILRLMQRIEGLTILEIAFPQSCCGGYCGETLLHPEEARKIAGQKNTDLPPHSTLVVTSPDCWGQFAKHAQSLHLNICYPLQIFMQAQIQVAKL